MTDRVHPEPPPLRTPPENPTPPPPSRSFVIQLPKDQIYRIPPPENAYRFNFYTRRAGKLHRHTNRRCLIFSFITISLIIFILAATAGILYLIFLPKLPAFTIESLSIHNLNLSTNSSPKIDLTVRSKNPNKMIGFYYRSVGSADVAFSGDVLCRGAWPSFYQGKKNVTVVRTTLKGSGIRLSDYVRRSLTAAVEHREVPLQIRVKVPLRMRFGIVTSWTKTVTLRCDVTVDKITADSKIGNQSCRLKIDVF